METILQFTVTNQTIERTDEFTVVEGSDNYLQAQFNFVTPDWDGLIKTGVFIDADGTVHRSLCTDDICDVPPEWLKEQKGAVGVIGSDGTTKITTNAATVRIKSKGYEGDGDVEEESESYFDQIMQSFAETKEFVTAEADRAEAAKDLVFQTKYEVAEHKIAVEKTVSEFEFIHQQAVADVNNAGQTQTERVEETGEQSVMDINTAKAQILSEVSVAGESQKETVQQEGKKQVEEVRKVADGIAQETTAQRILENSDMSLQFLEEIAQNSGKAGSLNGFGLNKGENDTVVISYTNPETQEPDTPSVFPADSTLSKINEALAGINESLRIIALQKGADV